MLVYNTSATTGVGYYYWSGSAWVKLFTAADVHAPKWSGNNNTTDAIGRTGNVGVGTASPGYKLDVVGDIRSSGEHIGTLSTGSGQFRAISGSYGAFIRNDGTDTYIPLLTASGNQYGSWNSLRPLRISNSTGDLHFVNGLVYMRHNDGYLGIGTTSPAEKLHVIGNTRISSLAGSGYRPVFADANGTLTVSAPGTLAGGATVIPLATFYGEPFINSTSWQRLTRTTYTPIANLFSGVPVPTGATRKYYLVIRKADNQPGGMGSYWRFSCDGAWNGGSDVSGHGFSLASDYGSLSEGTTHWIEIPPSAVSGSGAGTQYWKLDARMANAGQSMRVMSISIAAIDIYNGINIAYAAATSGTATSPLMSSLYENIWSTGTGGNVGIGTSAPSEKLEVSGNAKATGYIVAGSATTTSTTRYGEQTIKWDAGYSYDADGYRYITIGSISLPTGVSSININTITWECDGAHEDGNEDHGIWVGIGSTSSTTYYGWGASVDNGYHYIDWHYINDAVSITVNSTNANVYIRLEDEDCVVCGNDDMKLYNMSVTLYYSFSVGLQSGDIAASGRVYANNTTAIGDLAEHFEFDGPVVPGYVVSYVEGSDNDYELCEEPYSDHITGVISDNPSVVLNSPNQGPPLALAGRVNVKVVDTDELIKGGDFLTSSSTPGYAMKAIRPGPVIGYAVKNQIPGENFVEVLLQPGKYYIPPKYIDDDFDEMEEKEEENKRTGKW